MWVSPVEAAKRLVKPSKRLCSSIPLIPGETHGEIYLYQMWVRMVQEYLFSALTGSTSKTRALVVVGNSESKQKESDLYGAASNNAAQEKREMRHHPGFSV